MAFKLKNFLNKILFIISFRNLNFNNTVVFCYNVVPVILLKLGYNKKSVYSNHGLALTFFNALKSNTKNNIFFIGENSWYLKFLPRNWKYVYHYNKTTYHLILDKHSFYLITSGNTYRVNNYSIVENMYKNMNYNFDSYRKNSINEHFLCLKAKAIFSISSVGVFDNFKLDYGQDRIFNIGNSSYVKKRDSKSRGDDVLMLAGKGSLHKGVDVFFELATKFPKLTFHLVHRLDVVVEVPRNVIVHGFLNIKGNPFARIIDSCRLSVFCSISEGFPGSVCDTSFYGVLPLVPAHLGLEIHNCFQYGSMEDLVDKFIFLYDNHQSDEILTHFDKFRNEVISEDRVVNDIDYAVSMVFK